MLLIGLCVIWVLGFTATILAAVRALLLLVRDGGA